MRLYLYLFLFIASSLSAQDSLWVEGYVYETNNRGFLKAVELQALRAGQPVGLSAKSDRTGKFLLRLPVSDTAYQLSAKKEAFHDKTIELLVKTSSNEPTIYTKIEMERLPGYLLEASITELVGPESQAAYSIDGVTIEVYNNTLQREELRMVKHPQHTFSVFLEQGNEYIFMLRKEGYYTKRLRANINVNGCILCMEGFGTVTPGVLETLSQNNTKGFLLTTIGLKKMILNETVQMPNIYYDLGKSNLRAEALPQLDMLADMLKDNPKVVIELSSHTDCRGSSKENQRLSQSRAENVVDYILQRARIPRSRIQAKGYGESKPVNSCRDGIECSEELHQQNRRTEFTIIDIQADDLHDDRPLASIMQEENLSRQLAAIENTYVEELQPVEQKKTKTIHPPLPIPFQYTGFKVQLLQQTTNPDLNDPIFQDFEQVFLDVRSDGAILFLIGDFSTKSAADRECALLKKHYPKAVVVEYAQGLRKG